MPDVNELMNAHPAPKWKDYINVPHYEAYCCYWSCRFGTIEEILLCSESFKRYLNNLVSPTQSEVWISMWLYKTKTPKKGLDNYFKAQIISAANTVKRLIERIRNNQGNIAKIKMMLNWLVADLKEFVVRLDENQHYSFIVLSINKSLALFYYDALGFNLFGQPDHSEEHNSEFALSTLLIRHIIETRIKSIIGLDYLTCKGKPVSVSEILKFFPHLKKLKSPYPINFEILQYINEWANHYLHRGLRPEIWQIENAYDYLLRLFKSGETTIKGKWSRFASFETPSLSDLRKEFLHLLEQKYPENKVEWSHHAEIVNHEGK